MTTHKLADGIELIESLCRLGEALGYKVRTEAAVKQSPKSPAVDIAWVRDAKQRFPLFVLEVETAPGNSAAYNPVKVFAHDNVVFEKPLFFFHVFLSGGKNSSRINDLRELFGKYNYRTYKARRKGLCDLLQDVMSQHRRVSVNVPFQQVCRTLLSEPVFAPFAEEVTEHVLALKFDEDVVLHLARLTLHDERFEPFLLKVVEDLYAGPGANTRYPEYPTYFGHSWSEPVHIALLQHFLNRPSDKWLQQLRSWQERTTSMSMIGPHFGLSRDYDDFLVSTAPVLLALVSALMRSESEAGLYVLSQAHIVFDRLAQRPGDASVHWALWMLHISAACDLGDEYENFRQHIRTERGDILQSDLYSPPGVLHSDPESNRSNEAKVAVPTMRDFQMAVLHRADRSISAHRFGVVIALRVLVDEAVVSEWGPVVASLLARSRETTQR